MANQKISQLTAVITPADTDLIPVAQGGSTKSLLLSQVTTHVMANSTADDLPFSDVSSNGLSSTNTGDAIRELDDNFDSFLNLPTLPQYATAALPNPISNPFAIAMVNDSSRGTVPVYSNGSSWLYFSDDSILVEGVEDIPYVNLTLSTVAPIITSASFIETPPAGLTVVTLTAPLVAVSIESAAVDAALTTTVPSVVNTTP